MIILNKYNLLLLISLFCLAFLVFYPGLSGGFVLDDIANLIQNDALNQQHNNFNQLILAVVDSGGGILNRPVSFISFALNTLFWGLDPYFFKLINVFIHLLNGLLFYQVTKKLLHRLLPADQLKNVSLIVAGVFLLHPLTITSVLYIVQRMNSLSALFSFLGLFFYISGRMQIETSKGICLILIGIFPCTALAFLSKENGLLLPLYCCLTEVIFFQFRSTNGGKNKLIILIFSGIAITAAAAFVYLILNFDRITSGYSLRPFTLNERLLTESRIIWFYLRLILVPDIQLMGLYHDDISLSTSILTPWTTLTSVLGIVFILVSAIVAYKKAPVFSFGVLFFFLGHSMESTLIALELAYEHRNYLPMFGPLLILVYYAAKLIQTLKVAYKFSLTVLILGILGFSTTLRAQQWSDFFTHAMTEVNNHPDSHRANYAAGLAVQKAAQSGQYNLQKAHRLSLSYFTKAYHLNPRDSGTLLNLIQASYLAGKIPDTDWYTILFRQLKQAPLHNASYSIIAAFTDCTLAGACQPTAAMIEKIYQQTLDNSSVNGKGRSVVLLSAGKYYASRGAYQTTIDYQRLAAKSYDSFQTQYILCDTLLKLGRLDAVQQQLVLMKQKSYYFYNKNKFSSLEVRLHNKRKEYHAAKVY